METSDLRSSQGLHKKLLLNIKNLVSYFQIINFGIIIAIIILLVLFFLLFFLFSSTYLSCIYEYFSQMFAHEKINQFSQREKYLQARTINNLI